MISSRSKRANARKVAQQNKEEVDVSKGPQEFQEDQADDDDQQAESID